MVGVNVRVRPNVARQGSRSPLSRGRPRLPVAGGASSRDVASSITTSTLRAAQHGSGLADCRRSLGTVQFTEVFARAGQVSGPTLVAITLLQTSWTEKSATRGQARSGQHQRRAMAQTGAQG